MSSKRIETISPARNPRRASSSRIARSRVPVGVAVLLQPFLELNNTLIGRIGRLRYWALDNPALCKKDNETAHPSYVLLRYLL